jgi:hypothetical protein
MDPTDPDPQHCHGFVVICSGTGSAFQPGSVSYFPCNFVSSSTKTIKISNFVNMMVRNKILKLFLGFSQESTKRSDLTGPSKFQIHHYTAMRGITRVLCLSGPGRAGRNEEGGGEPESGEGGRSQEAGHPRVSQRAAHRHEGQRHRVI